MLLSSEPPAPHVLAEYTEGRQVSPTGAVISIRSLHKSPSSTFALKAEKSSFQVCKGNYSQMSISQGNLERLPSYHPPPPGDGGRSTEISVPTHKCHSKTQQAKAEARGT